MLAEGRSLSEVLEIARRVYGPPENIYAKQDGVYACLGALRGRPWGDTARAEIRRVANEVVRGVPR
jgi:hypothetical protein